jgi:hypothetical protein
MKNFTYPTTQPCFLLLKKITIVCCLLTGLATIARAQPTVSTPANKSICTASNVSFTVTASGAGPLSYQWQESEDNGASWNPLFDGLSFQATPTTGVYNGTATPTLTITTVPSTMLNYLYNVVVTDKNGNSTTSNPATLTVGPINSLDLQPVSACPASQVQLTNVPAAGVTTQWQMSSNNGSTWANVTNGTDPSGAIYTGASTVVLTIANLPVALNHNVYRYLSSNGTCNNIPSGNFPLTVPAYAVVTNPSNAVVNASNNATFVAPVTGGSGPFSYVWKVSTNSGISYQTITDNATYSGSATNTLNVAGVTSTMYNYLYRVLVYNSGNCLTANNATAQLAAFVVLPVQLESFTAQKTAKAAVKLFWSVDGQYLPPSYTIQKSAGGLGYADIAVVKGDSGKISFAFTDDKPGDGVIQYRLKMTQQDGNTVYSSVAKVTFDDNTINRIELRPSVTTDGLINLYTALAQNEAIVLTVTDIAGRLQLSQSVKLEKGENYTPLNASGLSKGVYYVHISSNDGISKTLPFVKK